MNFSLASLMALVSPSSLNAAATDLQICPDGNCPLIGTSTFSNIDSQTVATFIIGLAQFLTYISIALAVLFLVISGLQLVTDTGDGKRAESARKNFTTTLIGLVLVIVAVTIVQVLTTFLSGDALGSFTF